MYTAVMCGQSAGQLPVANGQGRNPFKKVAGHSKKKPKIFDQNQINQNPGSKYSTT